MHRIPTETLTALFERRVSETPDKLAYRYLGDTNGPKECTYRELRDAAYAIAVRLRESGQRGERVLLLYPPGLEFIQAFFGCMLAGAIAVPAPPPNPLKPKRSLERLVSIVESAWPTWALTTSTVLDAIRPAVEELTAFEGIRWMASDTIKPLARPSSRPDPSVPSSIALIQYTSGSTSDPKGAALTHANVLHNVAYFDQGWEHMQESVLVNWLPAFHDLGLFYGILTPLWGGFLGIQMSPIDVIQRPFLWLQAMSNHRATHSAGPNFIYDLCARKISDEERQQLDLSAWRMALTAAEPVRAETMNRFIARFGDVGFSSRTFCPGYGLSEATCKVAAAPCAEEPTILSLRADRLEQHYVELAAPGLGTTAVVGCGKPSFGVEVRIVDPDTRKRRGENEVGEIWVAGANVADHYWNQPDATEEQLRARIVDADGTPYLRTGDLGFLHGGELFITGRIKDLIIVRGNNHYPQDIEATVQDAHPSLRAGCVAAFAFEDEGEEKLAIVAEVERRYSDGWIPGKDRRVEATLPALPRAPNAFSAEEVINGITRAVAESHGLRVHRVELIRAGSIPKTTSGKIQRNASKRAMFTGRLERIAAGNRDAPAPRASTVSREALREQLATLVSNCASVPREKLRAQDSLHSFGVDSLAAVNIAYEIGLITGRDVPANLVSEQDTIDKLVDFILVAGAAR